MDYEKAYKAVLKTATQWIKDGCTDKEKICLECVFPELRESEDERVIKALETFINQPEIADKITFEARIEWLSWLEKQKEQKPAWSEEDEKMLDSVIQIITHVDDLAHEPTYAGPKWTHPYTKEIAWLKSLRPSWKPSEEQMKALEIAFRKDGDDKYRSTINSLYNDLKKL